MGGGGKGDQEVSQTVRPWGPQANMYRDLFGRAEDWIGQQGGPYFPEESLVAGFTPYQQQAQEMASQYAQGGIQPLVGQTQQAAMMGLNPYANPFVQMTGGAIPGQQQYLQSLMQQPGMTGQEVFAPLSEQYVQKGTEQFLENVLPGITQGAQAAGGLGGSRDYLARGTAAGEAAEAIAQAQERLVPQAAQFDEIMRQARAQEGLGAAGMLGQQALGYYQPALQAQAQFAGLSPQIAGLGLMPSQILGDVGAQQQALQQAQLGEMGQRFQQERLGPYEDLARYQSLIGSPVGQTQTQQMQTDPLMGLLGGGMLGLGAMQGYAGMSGGAVPAFSPLTSMLGGPMGAAASWAIPGALAGLGLF